MSSDNLNYDEGALRAAIKQSKMGMTWLLDINAHENKSTCGGTPNVTNHGERTDVESKLRNLDKPLSNDPSKKTQEGEQLPTLDYSPPYLCERAINHPDLKVNIPFYTDYQNTLRTSNPNEVGVESNLNNEMK
jgi:hypothetical protein